MNALSVKFKLTAWFVILFFFVLVSLNMSQYWLVMSGLKETHKKEVSNSLKTLDNLIVTSYYDPFDISHLGESDMFKITDDEKTLLSSDLWEQNKLDSISVDKEDTLINSREKRINIIRAKASKDATAAIYQAYDFFKETLEKGDTTILKKLSNIRGVHMPNILAFPKGNIYLFVAKDVTTIHEVKIDYLNNFLKTLPAILVLLVIAGYFTTRRFLSPLSKMAAKADEISAENLAERLPVKNPHDEFGKLATVINKTLSRLQESFDKLRQFTANVSHELRTPLTAIRSVGEVALKGEPNSDKYRDSIESMLEEADRLKCLIDKLMLLSRADAGKISIISEKFAIDDLINSCIETLKVLAEEKNVSIHFSAENNFDILADKGIVRQALVNVLDNAIYYSPANSTITIATNLTGSDKGYIDIIDQGPGIPSHERTKVFDRFYRTDGARSRKTGGSGLGLAIAKWAVEANKGTIAFIDHETRGCACRITFPLYYS